MLARELTVHALHGFAGCQAEDQMGIGPQFVGNDLRDERCRGFVSGLDDDFQ